MSFLRHEQIYQSDVFFRSARGEAVSRFALPHRLDESATGYSLAGCSPALPASASPAGFYAAPNRRHSQALLNGLREFSTGGNRFSALDIKKVLAGTLVSAVQQFMSWVRSVGRF
jgi:hypothetical protein